MGVGQLPAKPQKARSTPSFLLVFLLLGGSLAYPAGGWDPSEQR